MSEQGAGLDVGGWGLSVKQIGLVLGVAFGLTLAVMVGKEMSAEAMAVVIGVVCGVAAGLPTGALLLVVLTRRERYRGDETEHGPWRRQQHQRHQRHQGHQGQGYPPVVVIQGGAPQGLQGLTHGYWPTPSTGPEAKRQFHVVGGDDLLLEN
ncbi:hypothetical protein ACFLWA_08370 [Chloroflexota bacterium]